MVILEKLESTQSVSVHSQVGKKSSLYCTSVGKVILANLPQAKIDHFLDTYPRVKYTDNTIVDKEQLLAELEKIRQNGYAIDIEERELGVRSVAVPTRNLAGTLIGGLSVTGPRYRMTDERIREIRDFLLDVVLKKKM
ncbi:IclR family transcriptional regulator [Peptococcaceae bacterium 1198_IL3148]